MHYTGGEGHSRTLFTLMGPSQTCRSVACSSRYHSRRALRRGCPRAVFIAPVSGRKNSIRLQVFLFLHAARSWCTMMFPHRAVYGHHGNALGKSRWCYTSTLGKSFAKRWDVSASVGRTPYALSCVKSMHDLMAVGMSVRSVADSALSRSRAVSLGGFVYSPWKWPRRVILSIAALMIN